MHHAPLLPAALHRRNPPFFRLLLLLCSCFLFLCLLLLGYLRLLPSLLPAQLNDSCCRRYSCCCSWSCWEVWQWEVRVRTSRSKAWLPIGRLRSDDFFCGRRGERANNGSQDSRQQCQQGWIIQQLDRRAVQRGIDVVSWALFFLNIKKIKV